MHISLKYLSALGAFAAVTAIALVAESAEEVPQNKYAVKVDGGLAFSEIKGFEGWQAVSVSHSEKLIAVIVANPIAIEAYKSGIPANGKSFPDGAKIAKIHWNPKMNSYFPVTSIPGTLHDIDFMEKDANKFSESGGWGYAMFKYDDASATFTPQTLADRPPQGKDAKCGLACHSIAKATDYVFTEYGNR